MARFSIWVSMLGLVASTCVLGSADAAQVSVPGTRVELQPPEGFKPSGRFPGFEHAAQGASIMVTEMPAGYAQLRAAFTREGLASRGMQLVEAQEVELGGNRAHLAQVNQSAGGIEFRKWMLLAPNGSESVLVVGTVPRAAPAALGDAVRRAVLSTSLKTSGAVDSRAGLPFDVDAGPRLKVARRMGNMLLLNPGGTMTRASPEEPLYVVGPSVGGAAIGDLQRFAEQRARQTAEISALRGMQGRRLKVDGLEAYEIVADASDLRSGLPLRFYQVIAPDGTGYFMFQGLVGSGGADQYLAEFRRVTESFRRREATVANEAGAAAAGR